MFSVIKKGGNIQDGKGGAFDSFDYEDYKVDYTPDESEYKNLLYGYNPKMDVSGTTPVSTTTETVPKNMVVFPSAPDMKIRTSTPEMILPGVKAEDEEVAFGEETPTETEGTYEMPDFGIGETEYLSDEEKKMMEEYGGPKTFALSIMSDKEKLKALFPGVPEENLPVGASLSSQMQDLETSLRSEV